MDASMNGNTPTLLAFHGKQAIKDKYVKRLERHHKLDQFIQGQYINGDNPRSKTFRGCAVGCTLHSDDHAAYETELGIPVTLAYLHDAVFEGLPLEQASDWARDFVAVIPVGADLSKIAPAVYVWLLTDPDNGVLRLVSEDYPAVRKVIQDVAGLWQRVLNGETVSQDEFKAAEAAARAAEAAARAAEAAARAAAWAAEAAAEAAARAAEAAARAAAWATARAAAWAAAWAAEAAAKEAFWKACAEKLLQLLKDAPVLEMVTE